MAETKVILTKSVNHLGHPGDVVSVKAGYARNYLIPQGLGFAWSKNAAAQIEAMKRARLAKAVATREEAVAAKELIEGSVVEIAAKDSESDQDHRRVRCNRRSAPGNLRFLHREGCR